MLRYSATEVFLESDLDPLSFMQQPVLPFDVDRLFSMLFATKEETEIHEGLILK